MYKKILSILMVITLVLGLAVGCGKDDDGDINNNQEIKLGELEFETVNTSNIDNEYLKQWIQENTLKEGLYKSETIDGNVYVLLSSGQKNTGGYSVEVTSVIGNENKILINGKLKSPKEGELVTEAITYPYTLIKLEEDNRQVELGDFQNNKIEEQSKVAEKRLGTYVGQIDSNAIEIDIDGESNAYTLSENIKGYFNIDDSSYKGIKEKDEVEIIYYANEETGQLMITDIKKVDTEGAIEDVTIGVYLGKMGNNLVEIEVSGEETSFRLTDDTRNLMDNNIITEGDTVSLFYEKDSKGQYVITQIQKEPGFYLNK